MKKKYLIIILVLIHSTFLFGQWSKSNISESTVDMASFRVGSKLMFAGGETAKYSGASKVEIYDTQTSKWTLDTMGGAATKYSVVSSDDWAVVTGGYGGLLGYMEIFNAKEDKWEHRKLPIKDNFLSGYGVGILGDNLFFAYDSISIYNLKTEKKIIKQIPNPRRLMKGFVYGTKIYFIGGLFEYKYSADIDIYDSSTNSWSSLKMSEGKSEPLITVLDNKLYIIGGRLSNQTSPNTFTNVVEVIDLSNQKMSTQTLPIKCAASNMALVTLNNSIAAVGSHQFLTSPTGLAYDAVLKSWKSTTLETTSDFYDIKGAGLKEKGYFAGARSTHFNKVYIYDENLKTWTTKILDEPRLASSIIAYNNTLIIAGGDKGNGTLSNAVDIYTDNTIVFSAQIEEKSKIKCFGDKSASLVASSVGGSGTYTYIWNNGIKTSENKSLGAGVYSVTVSEGTKTIVLAYEITQPDDIKFTTTTTKADLILKNGTASVTVNGGVKPYAYLWNTTPIQNTETAKNLPFAAYTVTITDNNQCSVVAKEILVALALGSEINITNTIKCFGDKTAVLKAAPYGGKAPYSFKWNNGVTQDNISSLSIGSYSLTISDAENTIFVITKEIKQPEKIVLTISTTDAIGTQTNGKAKVDAKGGTVPFTYLWNSVPNQQSAEISNLKPGTYSVTVTDGNGCKETATTKVKSTSTNELAEKLKLALSPNPTSDFLNINLENELELPFQVIDINGIEVYKDVMFGSSKRIDISNLVQGQYFLVIKSRDNQNIISAFSVIK